MADVRVLITVPTDMQDLKLLLWSSCKKPRIPEGTINKPILRLKNKLYKYEGLKEL